VGGSIGRRRRWFGDGLVVDLEAVALGDVDGPGILVAIGRDGLALAAGECCCPFAPDVRRAKHADGDKMNDVAMRIVVTGTSGAGKTTLARALAGRLALPHIELDAINWQAGWQDLVRQDPPEFVRRVDAATRAEGWVADGNYGPVRDLLWRRATHLVWLDYERPVIMRRVIARSLYRVMTRTELWPGTGNRERWQFLIQASHPIRWAWSTWRRRREETAQRLAQSELAHLVVLRLRYPREASGVVELLVECRERVKSVAG
jgi:adenylate kinase family enzyme